jgi:small subunit ribosomal protein S4
MRIGPKYKIARRLGSPIFEKTQSQKYSLSEERKARSKKKFQKNRTDYGLQLVEKQKARFFYGITEKQFKNYVKKTLENKKVSPAVGLFANLESRLDNAIWRLGLAPTHGAARQMAAHGHITVNGRRVYTPSYDLRVGDVLGIREGSKKSPLFNKENAEGARAEVSWIDFDEAKKEAKVKSKPVNTDNLALFDMAKVIEFYQR